jgi:hypothetical protein
MKKIAIIMVISLLGIQGLSSASELLVKSPDIGFWIKIYVKLHKPKFDCEKGFGFCFDVTAGIDGPVKIDEKVCLVKAKLDAMNQLVFEISEHDLIKYDNASSLPFFKDKNSITLDEPYTLSMETCRNLGASKPIIIKAGTYPIKYSDNAYTVLFKL